MLLANNAWFSQESLRISVRSIAAIYLHLDTGQVRVKFGVNLTCKCTEVRGQSIIVFPRGSSVLSPTLKASCGETAIILCVPQRIPGSNRESAKKNLFGPWRGERVVMYNCNCNCSLICSSWVRSPKFASWYEADLFYLFSFQQKQIQLLYVPSKLTWQITMISIIIL